MAQFNKNIRTLASENTDFRRVLLTQKHSQLVLMSIQPGDDIGEEMHDVDQILVFVSGSGETVLDGKRSTIEADSLVEVPAGTLHNFINTGREAMKLYTIYAPPEEDEGLVHKTKADAEADEAKKKHAGERVQKG